VKALVTGGAGFIGSNVVRLLLDRGCDVRVVDNFSTGHKTNLEFPEVLKQRLEVVEGDIRDRSLLDTAVRGREVVFHLAACVGNVRSLENPREDAEINVLGTINVLEAVRRARVGTVVYSSSAATFGEPVRLPVSEDHPQNPSSPYGVSKLAGEKLTLCYGWTYGFRTVCLRYFNVYGVNQRYDAYGNVIPIFARRLIAGEPLTIYGDGEQTRDFVNVRDVAEANWLGAKRSDVSGCYNIGCGTNITINSLAEILREASGLRAQVRHVDQRPGEVRHCHADAQKARTGLGFEPVVTIRAGLKEYMDWFRDVGTGSARETHT
jgi:nucleoside-diphosphate-sugar epimerase